MDVRDLTNPDLAMAVWKKSSRSADNGGNCVEVATNLRGVVAVRDSKNRSGAVLAFTPDEWRTFLSSVKRSAVDQ